MAIRDETTFFKHNKCLAPGESDNIGFSVIDKKMLIEIESPWYGDSINGFGATLSIDLEENQIKELIEFLKRNFLYA